MKANLTNIDENVLNINTNYQNKKFKILEFLDQLPYAEAKNLKKQLPTILGVTRQTFAKYCNAEINDKSDMTTAQLFTLCKIFNVEPSQLVRFHTNTIQKQAKKFIKEDIGKKVGLVK